MHSPMSRTKGPTPARSPVFAMLGEQPTARPKQARNHRVLSTAGLVAIAYLLCCCSPAGNEPLVALGGPVTFFGLLMCFVVCYTFPISYVVAELSSAFPDDGGVAIWVMNAFGPFWGFQTGYWIWLSVLCACVVTPDTVYLRFGQTYGFFESQLLATLFKVAVALVLAVPSFFSARVVARLCLFLGVLVLIPFVLFTVTGLARGHAWEDLIAVRRESNETNPETGVVQFTGQLDLQLLELFKMMFYGFDGIVLISVFGGEVSNPAVTYASAIFIKLVLQVGSFVFPFAGGIVYGEKPWYAWEYGTFAELSETMGSYLGSMTRFSIECSNAGFFLAGMFSQAYLLYGMAHVKLLPRQVARRSERFGTPNVAAVLGVIAIVFCVTFEPVEMPSLASAFSALCQLMVILTVIRLRMVLPDASRPTRVPGNLMVLCGLMVLPVCILCFMVYTAFQTPRIAGITGALVLMGFVFGWGFQKWRAHDAPSVQQSPFTEREQEITF